MIKCKNPVEVAKEMFWLAWQACGGPLGMGYMQDAPDATKEDVWDNIQTSGDYPGKHSTDTKISADYVFGRMMKLYIEIDKKGIIVPARDPTVDYQAWSCKYNTYQDLFEAAKKNRDLK